MKYNLNCIYSLSIHYILIDETPEASSKWGFRSWNVQINNEIIFLRYGHLM